ncbi:MAG: aldose 1-epimerase family protein [Lachnospiraceae bacterium]|nr:aldose 1-epimerase family protein [Lachnospiraceae bacterium]
MIFKLENAQFQIRVSSLGAELQSLYSKATEREYLWQAAPEAWDHHSLLLFPCCGRIDRSRILARGREWPLAMHGFAKDMEFSVLEQRETTLVLELSSDETTLRQFPYRFRLRVRFSLTESAVEEAFEVFNDDDVPMPFSLGGHPAFFCPVDLESAAADCVLEFDRPQEIVEHELTEGTRLIIPDAEKPFLSGTTIHLSNAFFNDGPKVLSNVDADFVRLRSEKTGHFMEMSIAGFPFMTLWGQPGRMTVIAIEPWCGTSDVEGTDHVWENKFGNEFADPGETFRRKFRFRLG